MVKKYIKYNIISAWYWCDIILNFIIDTQNLKSKSFCHHQKFFSLKNTFEVALHIVVYWTKIKKMLDALVLQSVTDLSCKVKLTLITITGHDGNYLGNRGAKATLLYHQYQIDITLFDRKMLTSERDCLQIIY